MVTDTNSTGQHTGRTIMFTIKFGEISVLRPLFRNHYIPPYKWMIYLNLKVKWQHYVVDKSPKE